MAKSINYNKGVKMKWDKKLSDEFLKTNPKGTVSEFAKFVQNKEEKKYPRMYYAGSPTPEVGDIIFQEFKNGPKTKLPVCTVQDLVPGQLIEIYSEEGYTNRHIKNDYKTLDLLLFQLKYGITVFKGNTPSNNNFIVVVDNTKFFEIDSTIPSWVYA